MTCRVSLEINIDYFHSRRTTKQRVIPRLAKRAEGPHTGSSASAILPACSAVQTWWPLVWS